MVLSCLVCSVFAYPGLTQHQYYDGGHEGGYELSAGNGHHLLLTEGHGYGHSSGGGGGGGHEEHHLDEHVDYYVCNYFILY